MIFFGGGGGLGLVVLLFFSGGDPSLLLLLLFVGVPFLLLRMARRARTSVGPAPQQGWEPPAQPVLPPVSPADVSALRDRLGHDVRSLEPGDDAIARQAMADASERYATASALLERAGSDAQLRTA